MRIFFRLLTTCILAAATVFLPWWVELIVGALACFAFASYFEVIVIGGIADALYGTLVLTSEPRMIISLLLSSTVLSALALVLVETMKTRLIVYRT